MKTFCKPGDCLIYFKSKSVTAELIRFGERLQDPNEDMYAFHIAVALDKYRKIETNGAPTEIRTIDYGNFLVFRPPYDSAKLPAALRWIQKLEGRWYGWIGVIDQGMRDLTGGYVHLPRWLITRIDNKWPYCSWEYGEFANRAGFSLPMWPPPSPEDVYDAVRQWRVR